MDLSKARECLPNDLLITKFEGYVLDPLVCSRTGIVEINQKRI